MNRYEAGVLSIALVSKHNGTFYAFWHIASWGFRYMLAHTLEPIQN